MPKGDRLKLKADPEDGTTPVANLLLEAVAMAKISGLQKGAILYLWRRTYGWAEGNKRVKERKIALSEWLHALDSTKARVSMALSELEGKNIIKRRTTDQWGGYYYSLNTNIASWNSDCINLARLSEMITVADFVTVTQSGTVTQSDNSSPKRQQLLEATTPSPTPRKGGLPKTATVAQNGTEQLPKTEPPTLYKETLKKVKEIYTIWNKQEIVKHQKLTNDIKRVITTTLKDYKAQEVIQAIKNYSEILKGEEYYFSYSWALKDFLKRGLTKFVDKDICYKNYLKDGRDGAHRARLGKVPTKYTRPEELLH